MKKKKLTGEVLYYDDGTSKYKFDGTEHQYMFKGLSKKGNLYLDGYSGATVTKKEKLNLRLKLLHQDTLEIITYILGKPMKEIWIRYDK